MQSLRSIVAHHGATLVLDAASATVHAGVVTTSGGGRWKSNDGEAGREVFALIEQLGVRPDDCGAFVFCEGPGSILGIRIVAMVLRTWCALAPRAVFAYRSLELAAAARPADSTATLICDARRQSWHELGPDGAIRRRPTAELGARLAMPRGFRTWTPLPAQGVLEIGYEPALLGEALFDAPLLRPSPEPDAFVYDAPQYALWEPKVHQAPPSA